MPLGPLGPELPTTCPALLIASASLQLGATKVAEKAAPLHTVVLETVTLLCPSTKYVEPAICPAALIPVAALMLVEALTVVPLHSVASP
jgi:hypothetical protein